MRNSCSEFRHSTDVAGGTKAALRLEDGGGWNQSQVSESICAAQLITEDEGLGRLAQTVQVLVDLAPTAASHRRASRPEPLGADRLSTAPSFS
ncbi:unnamed protein product [Gadus morhua 'NCC']